MTVEDLHEMAASAARQWIEIFNGDVPKRLLNPAVWPAYCKRYERILGHAPRGLPEVSVIS